MKPHDLTTKSGMDLEIKQDASERKSDSDAGLIQLKIDTKVFEVLKRKRRAGETIRMVLERAIMTF